MKRGKRALSCKNFVLAVMPSETAAALRYPATLAILSYRIVGGRLMRDASSGAVSLSS